VREQKVANLLLIVGHRLDVHERAREFEEVHIHRILKALEFSGGSEKKGRNREGETRAAASR
jgi:hypothetical protein